MNATKDVSATLKCLQFLRIFASKSWSATKALNFALWLSDVQAQLEALEANVPADRPHLLNSARASRVDNGA